MGWVVGFKANCLLVGPGLIGGVPSVWGLSKLIIVEIIIINITYVFWLRSMGLCTHFQVLTHSAKTYEILSLWKKLQFYWMTVIIIFKFERKGV